MIIEDRRRDLERRERAATVLFGQIVFSAIKLGIEDVATICEKLIICI